MNEENKELDKIKFYHQTLITNIVIRKDKNGQNYWIISTETDKQNKSYFVFSQDNSLTPQTLSILTNFSSQIIDKKVILTIQKQKEKERVVEIELVKD